MSRDNSIALPPDGQARPDSGNGTPATILLVDDLEGTAALADVFPGAKVGTFEEFDASEAVGASVVVGLIPANADPDLTRRGQAAIAPHLDHAEFARLLHVPRWQQGSVLELPSSARSDPLEYLRGLPVMPTPRVVAPPPGSNGKPAPTHDTDSALTYRPFPVDELPEPIRGFAKDAAKAIGCDPSFVALPLLVMLAAAIGNSRRLQLKRGWSAPAIVWGAIVGESGTAKSPAFRLVMRAVRELQRKAMERYAETMKKHEAELAQWEKDLAAWKRDKNPASGPPARPDTPQAERYIVSDTTIEALAPILLANWRGLLLARDELNGWIGSFDRYAGNGRGGADAANWLSMFNAESIIVDRKTGTPRTIHVPRAAVSICGGIQPVILQRALGVEHRESGLAARLLLAFPPRQPKRWTEDDIDPFAEAELARIVKWLFGLKPTKDKDGDDQPVLLNLTPEAKAVWVAYYAEHAREQSELAGDLAAAWSKLEEYAPRLALVIHCVRRAALSLVSGVSGSGTPQDQAEGDSSADADSADAADVDAESMRAGVRLAEWFKHEARRVYAMLSETDAERDRRRLVEWIERRGQPVTPRDAVTGCRWLRTADDAEIALGALVKSGRGEWRFAPPGPRGGQPTRRFHLHAVSTVSVSGTSQSQLEVNGSATADSADESVAPIPPARRRVRL